MSGNVLKRRAGTSMQDDLVTQYHKWARQQAKDAQQTMNAQGSAATALDGARQVTMHMTNTRRAATWHF